MSIIAFSNKLDLRLTIRTVVIEDTPYKSYVMRRGLFMYKETREKSFDRGKSFPGKAKTQ